MAFSTSVLRLLGVVSAAAAASVTNCGGSHDHLSDVSIDLNPDPISRSTPFTLTLAGTLDEDLTGGELDVSLEVRALHVIDKAVRANTSYSLSPGVAKGPLKVVIGPVTLPQDPGEALLKGQVAIKNSKGEPVACIALDIDVPLAVASSPQETRQTDEPSFCNKPTDHFKNASLTQSGEVTQLTGTLDEDLNAVVAHVDLTVQALFVKLPLKLAIPMTFTPAIPKGDWKLSFQEVSGSQKEEALGSPVKIEGQIVVDDGKQEEVACLKVAAAGRDADIIV